MHSCVTAAFICALVLAIEPLCPAHTEESTTGKSSTGNIRWEIRYHPGNSTIWLWPDGQKDKATQLTGSYIPDPQEVEFSPDDAWIVVQSHLSSGSYFSFFRKQTDGSYAEDTPSEDFFSNGGIEKTATTEQVDRWSVSFDRWTDGFGPYAFFFSWSARLSRRGPDTYMMHCSGWSGVYDLQKHAVAKTLDPGRITTAGEDAEETLNQVYCELRSLVDEQDKESLRVEELAWLNKRDAIKNPQEKTDFTSARWDELGNRVASAIAEEKLNEDYRKLRNLLDDPGKESLRLEELAWLNKRDAIKSLQEKNVFTNFRVTELEDRIQKLRK